MDSSTGGSYHKIVGNDEKVLRYASKKRGHKEASSLKFYHKAISWKETIHFNVGPFIPFRFFFLFYTFDLDCFPPAIYLRKIVVECNEIG